MGRLLQIHEDDFAEIERIVPELSDLLMAHLTPRMRTQLRRLKEILSDVRWNYGPAENVQVIPANDQDALDAAIKHPPS